MPTRCCVPFCSNRKKCHIFPTDKEMRRRWTIAVRRKNWSPTRASAVCADHFTEDDYLEFTKFDDKCLLRRLKREAVPSQFQWTKQMSPTVYNRRRRYDKREEARVSVSRKEFLCTPQDTSNVGAEIELAGTEDVPVTVRAPTTSSVATMTEEVVSVSNTRSQADSTQLLSIEKIKDNPKTIHFYTGLEQFSKFLFVLQSLGPAAYELNYFYGHIYKPNVEDQFLLVLMKLRQRLCNFQLGIMFDIDEKDVYNIFITWVRFMSLQWHEIDIWPSRDLVNFYSPKDFFDKFPDTRTIIDGTECPIRKPTQPLTQQATFSSYKNRNTVKVVVGSTPGGLISHISPAFGGSTSDRHIIERSDLPKRCNAGDSIMADKGFEVQDLFVPHDVTVNIPSFFRKTNRLSGKAVLRDRKIASKRVHIERLIGLGKTYKILTAPLGHAETQLASDIIYICYMLCNFRRCIIPSTS